MSSAVDFGGAGSPTGGPGFVPAAVTTGGAGSPAGSSAAPLLVSATGTGATVAHPGAGWLPLPASGSTDAESTATFQPLHMTDASGGAGDLTAVASGTTISSQTVEFAAGAPLPFSTTSDTDDAFTALGLLALGLDPFGEGWFVV